MKKGFMFRMNGSTVIVKHSRQLDFIYDFSSILYLPGAFVGLLIPKAWLNRYIVRSLLVMFPSALAM